MAIYISDKTECKLCGRTLDLRSEPSIAFIGFLPREHRFFEFADRAYHEECFRNWEHATEFTELHEKWKRVWDARPRGLKTLEEIDEWGRTHILGLFEGDDSGAPAQ